MSELEGEEKYRKGIREVLFAEPTMDGDGGKLFAKWATIGTWNILLMLAEHIVFRNGGAVTGFLFHLSWDGVVAGMDGDGFSRFWIIPAGGFLCIYGFIAFSGCFVLVANTFQLVLAKIKA